MDRSPEQAYFQAIEEVFIALRGSPLLLSPSDWRLAQSWHREGIPLALVQDTLRELFERREEQGKGKVRSLRYCKSAVEAAWKRQSELAVGESAGDLEVVELSPAVDVPARLASLGRALPEDLGDREGWRRRLAALEGSPEEVEEQLAELDRDLLREVEAGLAKDARSAFERSVSESLAALGRRLPAAEVERASEGLRRQLLRQLQELPVLSLFAPEALD